MDFPQYVVHKSKCGKIIAQLIDPEEGVYCLMGDFEYTIAHKGHILKFTIPKGFVTNFATIPKVFWNVINPLTEGMLVSSCVHDFILNEFFSYQPNLTREYIRDEQVRSLTDDFTWKGAADVFYDIMIEENSYDDMKRKFFTYCIKYYFWFDSSARSRFRY